MIRREDTQRHQHENRSNDRQEEASRTRQEAPAETSVAGVPSISLPKGGGAIRGIGEKFAANPVTGTGSMTMPIATSPGRSGFGPQLSLSYDSGSGNGPFGFGWSLSLPAITRKTDKGLPLYCDADESDVYILSGVEDLVPEFKKDATGNWIRQDSKYVFLDEPLRTVNGVIYLIRHYRPRIEGLFARIERWTRQDNGEIHWRSISRDNITTLYSDLAVSYEHMQRQERPRMHQQATSSSPSVVVAGYVRRSSEMQKDNYSIDAQKRAIKDACRLRGLPEPIFYEDDERSARGEQIAKRPAFKQLLDDVQAGRVHIIVVHTLDRWSRNVMVTLQSFRILSQHHTTFISLSEHIDYSTPEGRLQLTILAAFAAYFSDMLAKHTSKGKGECAAQGLYNGDIPFGYRWTGPKLPPGV